MSETTKITTTIGKAKNIIRAFLTSEGHNPLFLHSSPGLGKSAIVKQLAEELGYKFIDVRLSMLAQSDVIGIPYVHDGEMLFSVPDWWPKDPNGKYILFFDEISNAAIGTQHTAYRIILDRELRDGLRLPDGCKIIAAGNLKEDKTGAKQIAPALANRFTSHIYIRPSLQDFTDYAINANIHESVIGFLNFNADALYRFSQKRDNDAFPTPRSWEQASQILRMDLDSESKSVLLAGCVGQGTAIEFEAFLKYYEKLPNFEEIMDGKIKFTVDTSDIGVIFAITSSIIVNMINNLDDEKRIKNLDKVLSQLPDDYQYMVYKSIKSAKGPLVLAKLSKITPETYKRVTKYVGGSK